MKNNSTQLALVALLVTLCVSSCTSHKSYDATTSGEIENLMKKGDMQTHLALKDLQGREHLYALGNVTNLKGFVVIDDSKPFVSFVRSDSVAVDSSWNAETTLLVYAQVESWKEIVIPSSITSWPDLEKFIHDQARENKINVDAAFPFLLKGAASQINWRVLDWDANDKEVTNKKIKSSGLNGIAQNVKTTIVGFYCTKQFRVLAEHDTKMHLHFVSDDRKTSGHIDDLILDGGMKLYLPLDSGK